MNTPDKIIFVHKGAMGDFLQTWPCIAHIRTTLPHTQMFWAGRSDWEFWLHALGIEPLPPALLKSVNSLYAAETLPNTLRDFRIIWFGLRTNPLSVRDPDLWFLQGIVENSFTRPKQLYLKALREKMALTGPEPDWRAVFPPLRNRGEEILIFPGSGHPMKCWPLERFKFLASRLRESGAPVRFILGPAEMDHFRIDEFPVVVSHTVEHLHGLVQRAGMVIGNDTGPMHLSSCNGIPGVSLFGPSSARQWAPPGMRVIRGKAPCRPCTQDGRISCQENACIKSIGIDEVWQAVRSLQSR
ncbi:MAG: glycosyltransferase family 9 protein [Desulfovibrionales bacterium]